MGNIRCFNYKPENLWRQLLFFKNSKHNGSPFLQI
jgi:hypothetical protein